MTGARSHGFSQIIRSFLTVLALLSLPVVGDDSQSTTSDTLWVASSGGALAVDIVEGDVYFDFPTENKPSAIAVDPVNSLVWLQADRDRVVAYDFAGQLRQVIRLPEKLKKETWLQVDPATGAIWAADRKTIFRIDPQDGVVMRHQPSSTDRVIGIAVDTARSSLWYATRDALVSIGPEGSQLLRVPANGYGKHGLQAIAYDSALDRLWAAGSEQLARYDARGDLTFRAGQVVGAEKLGPDGRGGVWVASKKRLQHVEQSGLIEFTLQPSDKPEALAVDTRTGEAWTASKRGLRQYNLRGGLIAEIDTRAAGKEHKKIAALAFPMQSPVDLAIESPDTGDLINDSSPRFVIRIDGPRAMDLSPISFIANERPTSVFCEQPEIGLYHCQPTAALSEGENTVVAEVRNQAGAVFSSEPVSFTIDSMAPNIELTTPRQNLVTNQSGLTVAGSLNEAADLTLNGQPVGVSGSLRFNADFTLSEGRNTLRLRAIDDADNIGTAIRSVRLDTEAPALPQAGSINAGDIVDGRATVTGEAGSVEAGADVIVTNTRTGESVTVSATDDGAFTAAIAAEPGDRFTITVHDAAGNAGEALELDSGNANVPPDPEDMAPRPPETGSPPLADRVAFLYEGANPIQQGVASGTIEPRRTSVLRGQVRDRSGDPLPGVRVTILNHPELGRTHTQADGDFDMAVNGGGVLTVVYKKDGFLPVQRTVQTQWNDWYHAEDVVMIGLDDKVTAIDLTDDTQAFLVARGSMVEDDAGQRRATLLFPAGTTAEITLPDGSKKQLSQLDVRATEYTVGPSGPDAMPGALPPTSAYTYAVELSVDQARAQGVKVAGKDVVFNQAVPFYVDNFLDFPTGEAVPTGFYNNDEANWVPYDNGRIVEVLSEQNGVAILDVTGNGEPATDADLAELNITNAERTRLSGLYEPGDSLWRVALTHLSTWDCNWPYGPPDGASGPSGGGGGSGGSGGPGGCEAAGGSCGENSSEENECPGCIISPQAQSLGESIGITGTPFSLNYQSNRAPGAANNTFTIPLTDGDIPNSLESVTLKIEIAGQEINKTFPPEPNQSYAFSWDGRDGFGRPQYGITEARVRLAYRYPCEYRPGDNGFGQFGSQAEALGTRSRCQGFEFPSVYNVTLESPAKLPAAVGSWSLSIDHLLRDKTLLRGDGEQRETAKRVIETFAGTGQSGFSGDGAAAIDGTLARGGRYGSHYLAVGPDGTVYIMDDGNHRIRAVDSKGIIRTVAGTGIKGYSGDGGPATQARIRIDRRGRISVGPDGSVYIAQMSNHVVRRVTPDGVINTVAGTGSAGHSGDSGPATQATLNNPTDIAVAPDGTLFITEYGNHNIRSIAPDGTISTLDSAPVYFPMEIWRTPAGTLYVRDHYRVCCASRMWEIAPDGSYREITREYRRSWPDDEGTASLGLPNEVLTGVGPGGSWYASSGDKVLKRASFGSSPDAHYQVPSTDGSRIFDFDRSGFHFATRHTTGGALIYEFVRNGIGSLDEVVDGDANKVSIERDSAGKAIAIVAPDGQRTTLAVNDKGHLTRVTDPNGASWSMAYTDDGLMTRYTDRAGAINMFAYNEDGRLIEDRGPKGSGWRLARSVIDDGYSVTMTSGAGRDSIFALTHPDAQIRVYTNTAPDNMVTKRTHTDAGDVTIEGPDGTTITSSEGPDPRFGLSAPVIEQTEITTPDGLTRTIERNRAADVPQGASPLEPRQLTESATVNGRTTESVFDGAASTWTTTTPAARQLLMTIDGQGRPTRTKLGTFAATERTYDGRGRLTSIERNTDAETRTTLLGYARGGADAGYLASVTGPTGRQVTYERDVNGRVTEQTRPDGTAIGFGYDPEGRLTRVDPPGRPVHLLTYDGNGSRTEYDPPDVSADSDVTRYSFNADEQVTLVERPDGKTVNIGYADGKPANLTAPAGTWAYGYDSQTGQLSSLDAPGGQNLAFERDGPLLTQSRWSGAVSGTVANEFDNSFRLAQQIAAGHSVRFAYDADSLLTQAGDLSLARATDHPGITATALNGITTDYGYNAFGELARLEHTGDSLLLRTDYRRDAAGRIVEQTITDAAGTARGTAYTYDEAGRLTQVAENGNTRHSYVYGPNGNRVAYTGPNGTVTADYDAQDRLTRYGNNAYTYNAAGDLTGKTTLGGTTNYDYDALGNLRQAQIAGGATVDYVIDGQNRRVGKKISGQLTKAWLYRDQLNPVAQLNAAGDMTHRFVYGDKPNVPAYMVKIDPETGSEARYRLISNHLGSVRLVVNADTGEIAQRMQYSPFGRIVTDTNPGFQPFGFAGGLYDQHTRLLRFGARDYAPQVGRWTAKDPIRFAGGQANLYGYVVNDPVNSLDPNGNFGVIGAVVGGVIGGVSASVGTLATGGSFGEALTSGIGGAVTGALAGSFPVGGLTSAVLRGGGLSGISNFTAQSIGISRDANKSFACDFNAGALIGSVVGGAVTAGQGFRASQFTDGVGQTAAQLGRAKIDFGINAAAGGIGAALGER